MSESRIYVCPGKCSECHAENGLPICWALKKGDRVLFPAHGAGLNPAAGARAKTRYLENIRRASAELDDMDVNRIDHVRNVSNRKTGDIPTINQPAGMTCARCTHCNGGCWESGECYAMHGLLAMYSSVKARVRNYLLYKRDSNRFFRLAAADTAAYKLARWHDSGDIIDTNYLFGMIDVARHNPDTKYLAMTKQLTIVNATFDQLGVENIPENLLILISTWKNFDAAENKYNLPTTAVLYGKEGE